MTIWIGATIGAAVTAFLMGGFWYGFLFARQAAALSPAYAEVAAMSGMTVLFEFIRCLALATALAILIRWTGLQSVQHALVLALLVWAGFQAAGLAGAVLHEGYPASLYAIHAGDALVKALVAAAMIFVVTSRFA